MSGLFESAPVTLSASGFARDTMRKSCEAAHGSPGPGRTQSPPRTPARTTHRLQVCHAGSGRCSSVNPSPPARLRTPQSHIGHHLRQLLTRTRTRGRRWRKSATVVLAGGVFSTTGRSFLCALARRRRVQADSLITAASSRRTDPRFCGFSSPQRVPHSKIRLSRLRRRSSTSGRDGSQFAFTAGADAADTLP